jgi:hypothetical protein
MYGFIAGCPACNTKSHLLGQCKTPLGDGELFFYLIVLRHKMAPIMSHYNLKLLPNFGVKDPKTGIIRAPWGPKFALQQKAKGFEKQHTWSIYGQPQAVRDPDSVELDTSWLRQGVPVEMIHPLLRRQAGDLNSRQLNSIRHRDVSKGLVALHPSTYRWDTTSTTTPNMTLLPIKRLVSLLLLTETCHIDQHYSVTTVTIVMITVTA